VAYLPSMVAQHCGYYADQNQGFWKEFLVILFADNCPEEASLQQLVVGLQNTL